ncbi:T3SS effector NleG family protein [Shigella flexneri]
MPLISGINSSSFNTGIESLRAQIITSGHGVITLGGERVSITYNETDDLFLTNEGNNSLLSSLLLTGLNSGPEALRERMLNMLSDSGETQQQESIQDKILQCKFSVNTESLQCPSSAVLCPITLEEPREGILIKNSEDSQICTVFDCESFSRVVNEGSVHPLTREPITAAMIVRPDECAYDPLKGNFIIKDS